MTLALADQNIQAFFVLTNKRFLESFLQVFDTICTWDSSLTSKGHVQKKQPEHTNPPDL